MIGKLTGIPERLSSASIIIDVNGVGYKVFISANMLIGTEPISLYIHTHVRDDALDLYGFSTKEALQLFKLIINISGIGPKIGLALVSLGVEAVTAAIAKADVDFFTNVPRLGKKNAQKIIIELKSKLGDLSALDLTGESTETKDAIEALIGLGFKPNEARVALQRAEGNDLDTRLKSALKILGKGK